MYHLFSCPIATHLSRLFIAAVPSRLRVLPELDFWGFSLRRRGAVLLRLTSLLSFRACRSRAHALGNKRLLVLSLPGPQWKEPSNKCVVSTRSSFGDRFLVLFPVLCWLICKPLNPSVFISFSTLCGSATWQAFLTNKGFAISEPLFRKKKNVGGFNQRRKLGGAYIYFKVTSNTSASLVNFLTFICITSSVYFKIAKWCISEILFWKPQACGTCLFPRAELQPQIWVSLCLLELSANIPLSPVSSLSFCVYECVVFYHRLFTLNLPNQNIASHHEVMVIILCKCIFKMLILGSCPTSDDFNCL